VTLTDDWTENWSMANLSEYSSFVFMRMVVSFILYNINSSKVFARVRHCHLLLKLWEVIELVLCICVRSYAIKKSKTLHARMLDLIFNKLVEILTLVHFYADDMRSFFWQFGIIKALQKHCVHYIAAQLEDFTKVLEAFFEDYLNTQTFF
jgi:hypothetical protein